jgi:ribokinase
MMDMISYMDRVPSAGETLIGDRFALGFGGKGANQAVMARRLGAEVSMVACVGTDVFGDMTIENFRAEGIDTAHVSRTSLASSGVAPIWVERGGDNRIVCVPGANDHMAEEQAAAAVSSLPSVDVVVGQFEIPQHVTLAGFRAAKRRGATTVLNPAPAAEIDAELLAATDWVIPNESEFALLAAGATAAADDVVKALAERLELKVVVTLGEAGAALYDGTAGVVRVAPPPAEAVDTTGAGDAFVGAFAFGLAAGMTPVRAVRLGCACASASVRRPGTQTSFPTAAETQAAWAWAVG